MIIKNLFLISSEKIPSSNIKEGTLSLSSFWGGGLEEINCEESPFENLNNLTEGNSLILLNGDSAQKYPYRVSWLEALGYWHQPLVILAQPLASGATPGSVFAYYALCKELSVPLAGVVQIGGVWDVIQKAQDDLPWCGWLPSRSDEGLEIRNGSKSNMQIEDVVLNIRNNLLIIK